MSILVIEDDASIRETLGFILEAEGYDSVLVESGEEGLEHLESCAKTDKGWPSLLMLDLTLPGMSGDEVFFEITRRFGRIPTTILMTAATSGQEKVKTLQGSLYLPKPFTLEQLSSTLEAALLQSPSTPGLACDFNPSAKPVPSEAAWI